MSATTCRLRPRFPLPLLALLFVVLSLIPSGAVAQGGEAVVGRRIDVPPAPVRPLAWSAEPVAVIGGPAASDDYVFGGVHRDGLVSDGAGTLFVLDAQNRRVLAYDPAGRHVATFGRSGEGPGEFRQPRSLAVGPGDSLWVADVGPRRFTAFPRSGGTLRTMRWEVEGALFQDRLEVTSAGLLTQVSPLGGFRADATGQSLELPDGDAPARPLLLVDPGLTVRDTVSMAHGTPMVQVPFRHGSTRGIAMVPRWYFPELRWAALPGGDVVAAEGADYRIRRLTAEGSPRWTLERGPGARATNDADRDRARSLYRRELEAMRTVTLGGGGPDSEVRERIRESRIENLVFADRIPRIVRVVCDPRGRIWVGVSEDVAGRVARIDVYEGDGTLIGEIRGIPMPDVFVDHEVVARLEEDDLGVQSVSLYRIREGG